jgi:hypothetical protein
MTSDFKMPSKEYFRGRVSAFNAMLGVCQQMNQSSMVVPKPVAPFVIEALETLVIESSGDLERCLIRWVTT